MKKTNIILTGFMGCGKTTVGRLVAKMAGYTFIDTDQFIEEECGLSIPELFAQKGENAFRKMEVDLSQRLNLKKSLVIGTGGGLMLNRSNAEALGETGHIFCLTASIDEIFRRISTDSASDRPLLAGEDPKERIEALLNERKKIYDSFTQVATTGREPGDIAREIIDKSHP